MTLYTLGFWNIFPYNMAETKVPCVLPTAVHLLTCAFMICHAGMKSLAFGSPAIYFPSFTSFFGRHSFPYSSLYRSVVLRHPTLLRLGMTGAKPLSFKSWPPQSKAEQVPEWNCQWTQMEIGESWKRTEGLNMQNAKWPREMEPEH